MLAPSTWRPEGRRPSVRRSRSPSSPSPSLQDVGREIPAAEQAHLDPHAAGAEGLLPLHGGEDRLARVFLGPHAAQPGSCKLVHRQAQVFMPLMRACGVASSEA